MTVKVIDPSDLLREASDVLGAVKDDVVVIGAVAVEVALHGAQAAITPTRDVDLVIDTPDVERVVRQLEVARLMPSEAEYERGFTWVRDDLKVQLIRDFHPFARGGNLDVPVNPVAGAARERAHREEVAFAEDPATARTWVATAACLVALKQHAFGRTRPPDDEIVRRDFHDVYLLVDHAPDQVLTSYESAGGGVRHGVREALAALGDENGDALRFAAEEMVDRGEAGNQRDAEAEILLGVRAFTERL